jgi:SAM-dependent methyltransferase
MSAFLSNWGTVEAVEYSPEAIVFLKKRIRQVYHSTLQTVRLKRDHYNLVSCIDVLYHKHIPDESVVLKKAYDALKNGGTILVMDCALPFFTSHHDTVMLAKKRYTIEELTRLVASAGFTIERSSYCFFLVFPLFAIGRLIDKFVPISSVSMPNKLLNTILFGICRMEALILRHLSLPIGSSCIVVGRKNQ